MVKTPRIKASRARARNKFRRKEMRTVKYTDAECVNHGTIMPDVNRAPVRLRAEHLSGAARRGAARRRIKRGRTLAKG